jgi:hypothetical protein
MKQFFYFILFVYSLLLIAPRPSLAAIITLDKEKKYVVHVALEKTDMLTNVQKRMILCFTENKKRIACGIIMDISPTNLVIKIRQHYDRLKDGMKFSIIVRVNPKKPVKINEKVREPTLGFRLMWSPYFFRQTRATYDINSYQGYQASPPNNSMWNNENKATKLGYMALSFNGEVELIAFRTRFGGSFKSYPIVSYKTFYDPSVPADFLKASTSGNAYSIYADYVFLSLAQGFNFAAGLEAEFSTVQLTGTRGNDNNDDSTTYYDVKSSRSIFSLRLPVRYDFSFNKVKMFKMGGNKSFLQDAGLFAGLTLAIPFAESGSETVITANDPLNGSKVSDLSADLAGALNQKRSSWSFETNFGAFFSF